ncbi:hypothetical protein [Serratia fonticola]
MGMKYSRLISSAVLVALLSPLSVLADTTVFGLTLGKTTENELKIKYRDAEEFGVNKWTEGIMYDVPVSSIDFEGVKKLNVVLDDDKHVTAVFVTFNQNKFNFVNSSLAKKYKLVKKDIPFVGNKYARYRNDNDVVNVIAPHMSFDMRVEYIEKETEAAMDKVMEARQDKKKEVESSQL